MRLLVLEDDAATRHFEVKVLEEEGFVVDATGLANQAIGLALANNYDGVILDLSLPDANGLEVIRAVRSAGRAVPILVCTRRHGTDDVIRALDAGADDYITKPTGGSLIRARVRALVRRGRHAPPYAGPLQVGNLLLNVANRRVAVGGSMVSLTPKETLLLHQLMLHAGNVVTRMELLEKVWDMNFDPKTTVVDTHVSRLRAKLKKAGATAEVKVVRGAGFLLEAANSAGSA